MSDTSVTLRKFGDFANPTRFLALTERLLPWLWSATVLLFSVGLFFCFTTQDDYQQGETVRIMYVHVPAALMAMMCYTVMAASALGTLVWRHPLADVAARAAAPIGAGFTLLGLVTGSLWGKPMWGAWWVWDARLTSFFVLFLMYLGLIALNRALDDPGKAAKVSAIIILVGFVNIPIIKFSVEWWNTLHQPASLLRLGGSAIDPEFLRPLLIMAAAFTALFFTLHMAAMRNEIWRRRVSTMRRQSVRAAGRGGQ